MTRFDLVFLCLSAPLVILGAWPIIANHWILLSNWRYRTSISLVPLIGGLALFLGLVLSPYAILNYLAPCAFLVDPGCLLTLVGLVRLAASGPDEAEP
jgi:hypothetical protein